MSTTRLSRTTPATTTTGSSPYRGSLRLPSALDAERIDKSSESAPSDAAAMFQPFTVPPKGALVFEQHVHRYPKPISGSQRLSIWYRGLFWETLEPWENILIHSLLFAFVSIMYLACSRVFAPAHLSRLTDRARWYLTGVASTVVQPVNVTGWPHL
ncbi:hypothetical protein JCM8202_002400 [Rhodotorula sphaerocarpa]